MWKKVKITAPYSAPFWTTLHPIYLHCTLELHQILLSYTLLHPTELPCTLLGFIASFFWATLHPKSYTAPWELHCTPWAMLHPTELCCILLSYAAPCWATSPYLHHLEHTKSCSSSSYKGPKRSVAWKHTTLEKSWGTLPKTASYIRQHKLINQRLSF